MTKFIEQISKFLLWNEDENKIETNAFERRTFVNDIGYTM